MGFARGLAEYRRPGRRGGYSRPCCARVESNRVGQSPTTAVAGPCWRGVSLVPALVQAGIDTATLENPDARVPASLAHDLWGRAEELSGEPSFGLTTAGFIKPGSFDVLDYMCRNSASVGDGLRLYCNYTPLLHDHIEATIRVEDDVAALRHVLLDGATLPRQYAEFIIASLLVIVRQASASCVQPLAVYFAHDEPADTTSHTALFGCPVSFLSNHNGFELSLEDFERPLVAAQPGLLQVLERQAEQLLERSPRPAPSLVDRVRAAIVKDLRSGRTSIARVARSLGFGERTLRRRLDEEGSSYQEVLGELRMELASRYLEDERLAIDEVAFLLGYSDRSAFIRAFRHWTDRTPAQFRKDRVAARVQ
ncbi:MAG: AraC family transcriptional regulator [Nannocystaceae bacterium]|nr:AraC family transcriptional regulator [Nannocystaceae bacterium]